MQPPSHPIIDRYGDPGGRPVFYFHGAPGFAGECAQFDGQARGAGIALYAINRFGLDADQSFDQMVNRLAQIVDKTGAGAPVELVGFSLGAFVALMVAARLQHAPIRLHLISAAAPLETGNYLPLMAGGPVFKMAKGPALWFRLFTRIQAIAARLAPALIRAQLFAKAKGAEKALAEQPAFRQELHQALHHSLSITPLGYIRDMRAYVKPWGHILAQIACPTVLYHGALDDWAPPAMAHNLAQILGGPCEVKILPDLVPTIPAARWQCR